MAVIGNRLPTSFSPKIKPSRGVYLAMVTMVTANKFEANKISAEANYCHHFVTIYIFIICYLYLDIIYLSPFCHQHQYTSFGDKTVASGAKVEANQGFVTTFVTMRISYKLKLLSPLSPQKHIPLPCINKKLTIR